MLSKVPEFQHHSNTESVPSLSVLWLTVGIMGRLPTEMIQKQTEARPSQATAVRCRHSADPLRITSGHTAMKRRCSQANTPPAALSHTAFPVYLTLLRYLACVPSQNPYNSTRETLFSLAVQRRTPRVKELAKRPHDQQVAFQGILSGH